MTEQNPTIKDVMAAVTVMRTELLGEIGSTRTELLGEIGSTRTELLGEIGTVRKELREEIQAAQVVTLEAVHTLATHMDRRFAESDAKMASKDFVDRKVDGVEERLSAKINKTDEKVDRLVDVLEKKDVLTVRDAHRVVTGS